MKTGLGLNFLRIVNEEGFDGWAQVYARIPFNDVEIKSKGALFGTIYSTNLSDWTSKEAEIMTWVDEYFNASEEPGNLMDIENYLKEKYPEISCVWMWVTLDSSGKREIRILKTSNVGVWMWREGAKIDMGKQLVDGKIIKGPVFGGDKIVFWSGEMKTMFEDVAEIDSQETVVKVGDSLMKESRGGAGLIFTFDEVVTEEAVTEMPVMEQPRLEDKQAVVEIAKPVEQESDFLIRSEMVSDRYVGKVGPKEKLINWWKNKSLKRRSDISIGKVVSKRKKMAMVMGVVFLLLLIVSIVSGSIKIKADNEQKKWSQFYEPIEKKRQDALGLTGVNVVGSRKLMEEVKMAFDAGKGEFVNTKFKSQLDELEKNINSSWSVASGEKQSVLSNQMDIGLVRQGFLGKRLSLISKGSFLVLDEKMGLVVSADSKSKEIKVLAGKGENLGWVDVVSNGKINYLLDGSGIGLVESGKKLTSFDAAVSKAVSIGVFSSNIYVLDQGNKEIYRYSIGADQFGDRVRWLKQDQSILGQPVDMAIDGDIWVLEAGNSLEKYRRGVKENFSLNGVPEKAAFSRIAVEQGGVRVALLDIQNGSVLLFKKEDGGFLEQLKLDSLKEATDIEFDEEGNLWVLIKGVVGTLK